MRVLTTWLRWGVLYRFPMGINSFHLPPFCGRFFKYFLVGFSSGTSRIAGFGEGTPQQDLPKGQNRRYADFGTVVESCSKKLPDCRSLPTATFSGNRNQLFFTHRALGWLRFARCMKKWQPFGASLSNTELLEICQKWAQKKQQIFFGFTASCAAAGRRLFSCK